MVDLSNITEIYVYNEQCDLRMGIQGLSTLAQRLVPISDASHKLFIFFGTNKRSVKILELDSDGWWLYQKRLFTGKFSFPHNVTTMTKEELKMFLYGLNIDTYREHITQKEILYTF